MKARHAHSNIRKHTCQKKFFCQDILRDKLKRKRALKRQLLPLKLFGPNWLRGQKRRAKAVFGVFSPRKHKNTWRFRRFRSSNFEGIEAAAAPELEVAGHTQVAPVESDLVSAMAYGQYARGARDPASGPVGRFLSSGLHEAEEVTHNSTQSGSHDLRSLLASTAKHTRRMGTIRAGGVRSTMKEH